MTWSVLAHFIRQYSKDRQYEIERMINACLLHTLQMLEAS